MHYDDTKSINKMITLMFLQINGLFWPELPASLTAPRAARAGGEAESKGLVHIHMSSADWIV